ncbi:MAG: zinc ribbon domain-containing protein [Candidatus Promineifilaceae bacterium]|nr:zinc ribbon domain-containing protein [Candidatus Promineifilaceae bacterium]
MTKKSLGYVELEWTCPNCGSRNPGQVTVCTNCGTAQPEDVEFHQPAEEKIIQDAEVVEKAKLGPDIHCAFCGTRNPANATTCKNCGADLAEGSQREAGRVIGAHRDQAASDIKCHYCGTMNPAEARQCKNCGSTLHLQEEIVPPKPKKTETSSRGGISTGIIIAIGAIVVVGCIALFIFLNRTDDIVARVNDVSWERQIIIMGLAPASYEAWRDQVPQEADLGACREEHRYTADSPQPGSREVCGTPYSVDTGSGFAEVVQDCEYLVYDDKCQYTVLEMQPVDSLILTGSDLDPQWPAVRLEADQQEGDRQESYQIIFSADGDRYTYTTRDPDEYNDFVIGSNWTLKVNQLGGVVDVEPAP